MEPPQKKVVVESKIKGPKRLGQGVRGIGIGKKKHHETVDSDDVEEQTGKDFISVLCRERARPLRTLTSPSLNLQFLRFRLWICPLEKVFRPLGRKT